MTKTILKNNFLKVVLLVTVSFTFLLNPTYIYAQDVTTLAGNGTHGSTNGTGNAASFAHGYGNTVDKDGNIFIADYGNGLIRKVTPAGVVTTFTSNVLNPLDLAFDANGIMYVVDYSANKILKVTPAGVVTTFAGSGSNGFTNGTGTSASFSYPRGIVCDADGNVFVADFYNYAIRKITPAGVVTTFAGGSYGYQDGNGTAAKFNAPWGITIDANGNLYVADYSNSRIRKITPGGTVSTFAGSGTPSTTDGNGVNASFRHPMHIDIDKNNNLFVSSESSRLIRKITPQADVTVYAGSGTSARTDGFGTAASFISPRGLSVGPKGDIYVTTGGFYLRKVTNTYQGCDIVSTFAGGSSGYADGIGTNATFQFPNGCTIDANGNVFVSDKDNHSIRKITPRGIVTTFAGTGSAGSADGTGTAASFNKPAGITVDASGNLYVADEENHSIRKITSAGVVTTLAGTGAVGSMDATGTSASFKFPSDLVIDASGNIFVADEDNHKIRKITPAGVVTTFAGAGSAGSTDATGAAASFHYPSGITIDNAGNLFVADRFNHKIRKITSAGVVTTFAGSTNGNVDDEGIDAKFSYPKGITINSDDVLFVLDHGNRTIRSITTVGNVGTFAGTAGTTGNTNGVGTAASFNNFSGIAAGNNGNLYVTEIGNNRIRKIGCYNACTSSNNLPTNSSTTFTSAYSNLDVNGWTHFCTEDEEVLLSLKIGTSGAIIPDNKVELKIGSSNTVCWVTSGGIIDNPKGGAMIDRAWEVTPTTQPSSEVDVKFYFTNSEFLALKSALATHNNSATGYPTTLASVNEMQMFKITSAGKFVDPHGNSTTGIILINSTAATTTLWKHTAIGSNHCAEFKVTSFSGGGGGGGGGAAPLPMDLMHFTAMAKSAISAKLDWATASETNNSHFVIERSLDGVQFVEIGQVNGSGSTNGLTEYNYLDKTIVYGTKVAYYRLKQVNYNGKSECTKVQIVNFNPESIVTGDVTVYPNPFTETLYLAMDNVTSNNSITITDIKGTILYEESNVELNNIHSIELSDLPAGVYFLNISSETSSTKHIKVVKQ